jgi:membrane-bound ClpP family serine protease
LTWACALAAVAGLLCAVFYATGEESMHVYRGLNAVNGTAVIALFIFCLLQIQIGLQRRSPFLVNLGMTFIALDILSAYFGLFGTMAWTGLMFVVSGTFLIAFGVALEKRRRALMRRIQSSPTPGNI